MKHEISNYHVWREGLIILHWLYLNFPLSFLEVIQLNVALGFYEIKGINSGRKLGWLVIISEEKVGINLVTFKLHQKCGIFWNRKVLEWR